MFLRADARVAVDGPEPYAYLAAGFRVVAVERRPADRAEALRKAAVAGVPALDERLAFRDPERALRGLGICGYSRTRAPLAAVAMAVVRRHEWLADLVAHPSAEAAAAQDAHGAQVKVERSARAGQRVPRPNEPRHGRNGAGIHRPGSSSRLGGARVSAMGAERPARTHQHHSAAGALQRLRPEPDREEGRQPERCSDDGAVRPRDGSLRSSLPGPLRHQRKARHQGCRARARLRLARVADAEYGGARAGAGDESQWGHRLRPWGDTC